MKERIMLIKKMGLHLTELEQAIIEDKDDAQAYIHLSKAVKEYEKLLLLPTKKKLTPMSQITVGDISKYLKDK